MPPHWHKLIGERFGASLQVVYNRQIFDAQRYMVLRFPAMGAESTANL
jgi:hypothetical protein